MKIIKLMLMACTVLMFSGSFAFSAMTVEKVRDSVCKNETGGSFFPPFSSCRSATDKITITNLTTGQPIVGLVAFSNYRAVVPGTEASVGLKELSQDAQIEKFVENDLSGASYVAVGEGALLPGESVTFTIRRGGNAHSIGVVAMLARTNDAFINFYQYSSRDIRSRSAAYIPVYDSGAEKNTESCEHIPAPPCNNPGVGTDGGDGVIRPHAGNLFVIGDLDPLRDAFNSNAAAMIVRQKIADY